MAEIKSYPNNCDEYIGAEEVMMWHHGRTSGVFAAGNNCAVAAVSGQMKVTVSDGSGWLTDAEGNGIVWWNDYEHINYTKLQLTIDASESTGQLSRIDRIIVEWNIGLYDEKPVIRVLKGTSASTPTAPALTNSSIVRQISIARILIPAAATFITNANITDERLNTSVCGLVTESVTADTSVINAQYQAAVDQLTNAIAQAWSGVISDGSISEAKIADGAVSTAKLKSGFVLPVGNGGTGATNADDARNMLFALSKFVKLWENASPTSAFAAQTVSLSLSAYDAVCIVYLANLNNDRRYSAILFKDGYKYILHGANVSTTDVRTRLAIVTNSGIEFEGGYSGATSSNTSNIPCVIYGLKGVI